MKTLKELVDHMKKYKDAIIIIGSKANSFKSDYSIDDFNENYNRKIFKRNNDKLWDFYNNKILTETDNSKIYNIIKKIDYSLIVNQNVNGPILDNTFNIHGNINKYICSKCKTIYTSDYVFFDNKINNHCELCDGYIRPSVLLSGERYDQILLDDFKDKIEKSHTLFLIGVDYNEEIINDLICNYGDLRIPRSSLDDTNRIIVALEPNEEEFDPNELVFCDFLVKDNIKNSLERFIEIY